LGAFEKKTILDEVEFILFLCYITVTCRHTMYRRFLRQRLLLKHQNVIYLRKYLIHIWCVLFYRQHHTFDVKTCFQQKSIGIWRHCDVMRVICFLSWTRKYFTRLFTCRHTMYRRFLRQRLLLKHQNVI
jgi:hypothetical protein